MSTKTVNVNIVSLPSLLTALFVGLKLTGHIDWSWWWVTSPAWLPAAVFGVFALFCLAMAGLTAILK